MAKPPWNQPVSVVIPFYGDPSPTVRLIEQLAAQEGAGDLQVIVADDHSPQPFPTGEGYEVVRRAKNGGFGANCNSGAARARHELLMFLNSDLELAPDTIAAWLRAAAPWQPAVTAPAILEPEGESHVARRFQRPAHAIAEWLVPLARFHNTRGMSWLLGHDVRGIDATSPVVTDWLVGAALLLPTRVFRDAGGFDELFYMNSEEVDLQLRLRRSGVPSVYLPVVRVAHESGGSSPSEQRVAWVTDSRFRYARKWGGARSMTVGLFAASGVNFIWNLGRASARRDVRPLETLRRELRVIRQAARP